MEPATWIALAAAIFGGAGLKVVEKWLNKSKDEDDIATKLRAELREDLERWQERAEKAEESEDKWRDRYYKLLEERELKNAADRNL